MPSIFHDVPRRRTKAKWIEEYRMWQIGRWYDWDAECYGKIPMQYRGYEFDEYAGECPEE